MIAVIFAVYLPVGTVIETVSKCPYKWELADGRYGRPDLRGKIVGKDGSVRLHTGYCVKVKK
jgi:hypothetical protein